MLCKKICTMSSVLFIYVTTVYVYLSKNPLFENQNELEVPRMSLFIYKRFHSG